MVILSSVALALAIPFPLPQGVTSTAKCDEGELDSFYEEFDSCIGNAETIIARTAASRGNLVKAICSSIEGTVRTPLLSFLF